jgi:hypothetical protein
MTVEARSAQFVSAEDIVSILAERRMIAHIWSTEDVQSIRRDLNDDQAWAVLEECERALDSDYGLTWTHIEEVASELYPEPEDE